MKKSLLIPAIAGAVTLAACTNPPNNGLNLTPSQLFEHQHGCHLDPATGNDGGQCWKITAAGVVEYVPHFEATFRISHDSSIVDGGIVTTLPA